MLQEENIAYFAYGQKKDSKLKKLCMTNYFGNNMLKYQKQLPKLTNFFFDCLLPEIVDLRHFGRPIRNPDYIIQAQKKKKTLLYDLPMLLFIIYNL